MENPSFISEHLDDVPVVMVGPGCTRRDLTCNAGVRFWVVDIAAGAQWPHRDMHDEYGEDFFVLSGEVIEGERRFGAGQHVCFAPHSSHQPHSETGVRLIGFNRVSPKEKEGPA